MEQPGGDRGQDDRDQHSRPVRHEAPQQEDQGDRADPERERGRIERRQRVAERGELWQQRPRLAAVNFNPPRSLSWLAKIVTAMPQVKPTVTACGM